MTDVTNLQDMIGRTAVDTDGTKIGKIGQIYLDDATGDPLWVTVSTGMFGTKESFAPLAGSTRSGDDVRLTVSKELVKDAPSVAADGHLEESENDALYTHYQGYLTGGDGQHTDVDHAAEQGGDYAGDTREDISDRPGIVGRDTSGPTTDDAMTRSEERLRVATERVESGRARLRKFVVTENVTETVPVSHEEVRVEREPITDANRGAAMAGGDLTEEEHEVTLHADRPVVSKETVPVERVRLDTEAVTEQQQVSETVRKEQIDTPDVQHTAAAEPRSTTR